MSNREYPTEYLNDRDAPYDTPLHPHRVGPFKPRNYNMPKQFRMDNTEGYTEDELHVLNEAFDIVWADEAIPADASTDDVFSDTRQFVGERVESYYVEGMTAAELVSAYNGRPQS